MDENQAAWLMGKNEILEVKAAPYSHPEGNQILVKNHAIALNPFDWIIQIVGNSIFRWIKYPFIIGTDVAGEVVAIGASVSRFKVGDRVLSYALGVDKDSNSAAQGAFQKYTIVLENMTAPIPTRMRFEDAAVLPLGISTAASGMFQKDYLALEYPKLTPSSTGKTLLIWGGSTSVGSNAIQLAKAAGYTVVTTCSQKNFKYVKSLGADEVYDYHDKSALRDLTKTLEGKTVAGALAIGTGSSDACLAVLKSCSGNKFIVTHSTPVSFDSGFNLKLILKIVIATTSFRISCLLAGVRTKQVYGSGLKKNIVSKIIFEDYLPIALESGAFTPAPQAKVIGAGLEFIQKGLDIQRKGVSAQKIVVTL
jgi:NADPH:quinone reductase-like Zn-dependent oxidoreductase